VEIDMKKICLFVCLALMLNASENPEVLYAKKCAACHGKKGEMAALGKAAPLKGQSEKKLEESIAGYKAGTKNVYAMGSIMKKQTASIQANEIKPLAAYIAKLK
jgi:cytochrome c